MMGKNHVPGGFGIAGIAVGGTKAVLKSTEPVGAALSPALDSLSGYLFLSGMSIVPRAVLLLVGFCGFVTGTLAPDMDNPNSILGRYCYIPVGHRKLLHSLWPVLLFVVIGCRADYLRPFLFFAVGYAAHLICDAFSDSGVKFFWPVSFGRHRLKLYTTGEGSEKVFLVFILILAVVLMVFGFWF